MIRFIDFKRRYRLHGKEINKKIFSVFKRGWFVGGPERIGFEKKFADYSGAKFAVGVNSGTDSIAIALRSLGVGVGDEVITVSHTATPTIAAIRMTGAIPVFVDVDEKTMVMNLDLVKNKITKNTKVILPVHLYGYPVDMKKIVRIARKHNLFVVEDSCQAHGARYSNKMVGTMGDIGCFSFYPTKNLGAFGDAGMMITNNKKLFDRARELRNFGEVDKYLNRIEGVNSGLDEIQAAVLNWGIDYLDRWNNTREDLALVYLRELGDLPITLPFVGHDETKRVWHLFVIRTKERDRLRDFLKKNNIESAIHYPIPVFRQEAYRFLGYSDADLPVTSKLSQEILSLPLYPELKESEVLKICKVIKSFYKK